MYLNGIWIKSIAFVMTSIMVFISSIYAYKKMNWKGYEFIFVFIVSIYLLASGCINIHYAINPEIETVKANYLYQSSSGVIFGREYFFIDESGNSCSFTMDPITSRKIFKNFNNKNKDFDKDAKYIIKYEKKSNTIVYAKEE